MQNVLKNNKGVSLVEVLIALTVSLILFLALMQSALLSINMNTKNVIRDEAINVAEERMRQLRGLPFDEGELVNTAGIFEDDCPNVDPVPCNGLTLPCNTICRNFKNFELPFTTQKRITDISAGASRAKQIEIKISWTWDNEDFDHTIISIKRG